MRRGNSQFIVVNDGGDHGNVAFRQAATVVSDDTGTCGNVLLTVRIEEHYELFDSTISPKLFAGISRLQSTAFIFIRTNPDIFEVVGVLYVAALNAPHPLVERRPFSVPRNITKTLYC